MIPKSLTASDYPRALIGRLRVAASWDKIRDGVAAAAMLGAIGWSYTYTGEIASLKSDVAHSERRIGRLETGETTPMAAETRAVLNGLKDAVDELKIAIRELRAGQDELRERLPRRAGPGAQD